MKVRFLILLAFCLLASFDLTGCSKASEEVSDRARSSYLKEGYTPGYAIELKDMNHALEVKDRFASSLPKDYMISADVQLSQESDADRMDYRIAIRKPVVPLKNLTMSFSLNPKMKDQLVTDDVFTSNMLNEEPISYSPSDDTNSIILARAFIVDRNKADETLLNIYKEMYVKISYIDPSGKSKSDYIKMEAVPSESLQQYLQSSLGSEK